MRQCRAGDRQPLWIGAILSGLFALGGCQQPTQTTDATAEPAQASVSLPADPPCPDHVTAVLSDGLVVHFMGSTDDDPEVCVQQWNGRSYRYYLGFWGEGRFGHGTPQQREALAAILRGPVGATTTVDLQGPAAGALWKSASVTHEADAAVRVGRHKRAAVKLRVVRNDSLGRSEVTAERLYWLDRETGIPLKKQTVTRMADGNVSHVTTWDVTAMQPGSAEAATPGRGTSSVD